MFQVVYTDLRQSGALPGTLPTKIVHLLLTLAAVGEYILRMLTGAFYNRFCDRIQDHQAFSSVLHPLCRDQKYRASAVVSEVFLSSPD